MRVRRRDRGQARPGSRPGGARLAASGEESPGGRPVCLRPDGGPLGGAENFTRVRSLPPRWPRWQPVCRPEMNCSFSILKKEAPGPPRPHLSGVELCVFIGAGGSADQPAPGRASVLIGGDASLQTGASPGASVSPSIDWGYNFFYHKAVCENEGRWLTHCPEKG